MSALDTETHSPTVRDHLEASYASHTPGGPDVENIVSGAVEQERCEIQGPATEPRLTTMNTKAPARIGCARRATDEAGGKTDKLPASHM